MSAENDQDRRSGRSDALPDSHAGRPSASPQYLRVDATDIIGREEDLAAITSLLLTRGTRLLTLTGPAGVGKTRLAREVGRTIAPHFQDGVHFIDLALLRDPTLVLPTLGRRLGVPDTGGPAFVEQLEEYLAGREMLLILDNLEQLLPADVGLEDILPAAPGLTILVTSRVPLHLLWEQLYHVPPLALPDPDHLPPLEQLEQVPAVALFLQRARMIDPDFRLSADNARAISELVARLDGLPLAIKLAAARTQLLSPQMLLDRLSRRLSLLHWEAEDLPERQQTLRAAIAWSYDLLNPAEQFLFRSLGVFVSSFTIEAAEAVAAGDESRAFDVLEGLASLVDKSLVQRDDDGRGSYRFRLLESVHEFALELLVEADELDAAKRRHAQFYLALAERAEPELTGQRQRQWFLRFEATQDNLRAALEWLLDHNEGEEALRLATALGHFWEIRGYVAEGRRWLEATLASAPSADSALRARALVWLGVLLVLSVDRTGTNANTQAAGAEEVLNTALSLARELGDTVSMARALTFLGTLSLQTGEWDRGKRYLQEARVHWHEAGHDEEIIQVDLSAGVLAFLQGEHPEAHLLMEEVLRRSLSVGDDWGRGVALLISIALFATQGEMTRAVALGQELLGLSVQSQSSRVLYIAAASATWLARSGGSPDRVARVVGAAESMHQAMGLVASVVDRLFLAATREALRARLEGRVLDAAAQAGRRLPLPEVEVLIQALLEEVQYERPDEAPAPARSQPGLLSAREQEVLQLIAEGFSNKQIARELIIAESTVRYHLTSIFNKLGVDTRTHALAVAAQRGLIQLGPPSR